MVIESIATSGHGATCFSRRAMLSGFGALAVTLSRPARAAIMGVVVVGKDDWLFPVWDEVRTADPQRIHKVTQ